MPAAGQQTSQSWPRPRPLALLYCPSANQEGRSVRSEAKQTNQSDIRIRTCLIAQRQPNDSVTFGSYSDRLIVNRAIVNGIPSKSAAEKREQSVSGE